MSLYGHNSREFQARPTLIVLTLVGLCQFLLALQLSGLALHAFDTALGWNAGWEKVLVIHAPFADDFMSPFFVSPPLGRIYRLAVPIVSGCGFVLAILVASFWPTGSGLSTRLFVHTMALVLGGWGVLSTAFRTEGFDGIVAKSHLPEMLWRLLFALAGLFIIVFTERRATRLLGIVFDVEGRAARLTLWTCRIPLPTLAVAAIAWLNHFRPGCWAMLVLLLVSVVDAIAHRPITSWERLVHPEMRGGALVSGLLAVVFIGGSVAAFGIEAIDNDPRVVEISQEWGLETESRADLLRKQLRDPESLEKQRDIIRFRGKEKEVTSDSHP